MPVATDQHGSTLTIRLDRPEKRNAIDREMALGLDRALRRLECDDALRCGVLVGEGPVFCAGTDLFDPREKSTPDGGEYGLLRRVRTRPLIAAVDGPALGGGFEIVLACDLVVASTAAVFGLPETLRGLVATGGGLFRTATVLPRNVATEMLLTGKPLTAKRAWQLGLVNRLVAPGRAEAEARTLATEIEQGGPSATALSLQVVRGFAADRDDRGWSLTGHARSNVLGSAEAIEGKQSFSERRPPSWSKRVDLT